MWRITSDSLPCAGRRRRYWAFLQSQKGQAGFGELEPALKAKAFLEHLAVERHVAAATQNQALNALVFI